MSDQNRQQMAADRKAAQDRVREAPEGTAHSWAGLTDTPTSPRENQRTDDHRLETAREDFERVLGH